MKQTLLTALKSSWVLLCAICYAAGFLIGQRNTPASTPTKPQTIREFAEGFPNVTKANLLIVSAAHEAGFEHEMELLSTTIPFAIKKQSELSEKMKIQEDDAKPQKHKMRLKMDL